ncbi:MAG: hypothetical protein F4184_17130 [Gemmatimonadetes bacterium]|nr:hypothetical protein [Gemmatimonadota bacterium]
MRIVVIVATDAELLFKGFGRDIRVCGPVLRVWNEHRQIGAKAEAFGVLVGTTSFDKKTVWIEAVTTPMRLDLRWRFGFRLLDKGHELTVRRMFEQSCRQRIYLGTWHTHPETVPTPSKVDTRDWMACHRANPGRPLVFVVVGTARTQVFVRTRRGFRPLQRAIGAS